MDHTSTIISPVVGTDVNDREETTLMVKLWVSLVYPDLDAVMVMSKSPASVGVPYTVLPLTCSQSAPETLIVHPETLVLTTYENAVPVEIVVFPWEDVISTSAAWTVMVLVAYSPDPSAAVARTVTVPAESPVRTIRPPVDVSLVVYDTWLVPLVIDQFTVLSSALLGEVVAVRVTVEPTCTVELPEIETDVTRTSGS